MTKQGVQVTFAWTDPVFFTRNSPVTKLGLQDWQRASAFASTHQGPLVRYGQVWCYGTIDRTSRSRHEEQELNGAQIRLELCNLQRSSRRSSACH